TLLRERRTQIRSRFASSAPPPHHRSRRYRRRKARPEFPAPPRPAARAQARACESKSVPDLRGSGGSAGARSLARAQKVRSIIHRCASVDRIDRTPAPPAAGLARIGEARERRYDTDRLRRVQPAELEIVVFPQ